VRLERLLVGEEDRNSVYRTISAARGVLLALGVAVDAMALFGMEGIFPWLGAVVTGLLLGRGTNWIHDFVSRWVGPIQPA
jgi:predicted Kef-type K+ transport protein